MPEVSSNSIALPIVYFGLGIQDAPPVQTLVDNVDIQNYIGDGIARTPTVVVYVYASGARVTFSGTFSIFGASFTGLPSNVERLTITSVGIDILVSNINRTLGEIGNTTFSENQFFSNLFENDDTMLGSEVGDDLAGMAGNDTLRGRGGDDT